jgi:hypothetical protein
MGGIGAHHNPVSETVVWLTPPHILAALGPFDLDPCACSEPRPWPTAARHYTREDNGLILPWSGRVFCNPPYGPPPVVNPWLERMAEHGQGVALIFARTETAMFHRQVWERADAVLFLEGRLTFCKPDGTPGAGNSGGPSCLIAYGEKDADILKTCGLPGAFVRLNPEAAERDFLRDLFAA